MFYLETLLYIDHCINVPATGFGKGHFIERKSIHSPKEPMRDIENLGDHLVSSEDIKPERWS